MAKGNHIQKAEKTCKGCGYTGPREAFPSKRATMDDFVPWCHECWPAEKKRRRDAQNQSGRWQRRRASSGEPVDRERGLYLDASRFVEWMDSLPRDEDGVEPAEWLGTTSRTVFRWRNENGARIPLDLMDRMLCRVGMPWVLGELYPELYSWGEDGSPDAKLGEWRRTGKVAA